MEANFRCRRFDKLFIKRNGVFGMIEVKDLTKIYGTKHAVDGITFTVNEGEILGSGA